MWVVVHIILSVLIASYNIFKPNFHEVLKRAEEIRKTIVKCQDILHKAERQSITVTAME